MQTETSNEYETYVQEVAIYEKNFFFQKYFQIAGRTWAP